MLGARQIEQKGRTRIADEADAAAMPVEVGQRYRIDHAVLGPVTAGMDRNRPLHLCQSAVIARSRRRRSNLGRTRLRRHEIASLRSQ